MATFYPAIIDNNRTLPPIEDGQPLLGKTINELRQAIIAIETELGVKPSSVYSTVKFRLDTLENAINDLEISEGIFTANGDLSGSTTSQTVIGIQGNSISSSMPGDGYLLSWNDLDGYWEPTPAPTNFSANGDLSGTVLTQTVIGIQGNTVNSAAPEDGYVLTWDNLDGYWYPAAIPVIFTKGTTTIDGITGKSPFIPATVTANSVIGFWLKTPSNDEITIKYAAFDSDRVIGTISGGGGFQISALTPTGNGEVNVDDTSTLDWIVYI